MQNFVKNINESSILKKIILVSAILIASIIVLYLLMVLVYCIPTNSSVKQNIKNSCKHFKTEVNDYNYMEHKNSMIDLYQDAIFISIAAEDLSGNPFYDAVKISFNSPSYGTFPQYDITYLYDNENFEIQDYPYSYDYDYVYGRYWHGYLLFLKPLLYFFDYGGIRTFLMFVNTLLFALLVIAVYKRKKSLVIPVILFYIFLNPITLGLSIMYFAISSLTMLFMIVVVRFSAIFKKFKFSLCLLFMIFGILTNYFDMMSYPFLTLFIPLATFFALEPNNLKENLMTIVYAIIFWAIGYFAFMFIKLAMVYFTLGPDSLTESIEKAGGWFDTNAGYLTIIYNAFYEGSQPFVIFGSIMFCLFTAYLIIKNKKMYIKTFVPFLIIALMPFAIMLVLKFHTIYHLQFSFREFATTYYAILCFCSVYYDKLCRFKKINKFSELFN